MAGRSGEADRSTPVLDHQRHSAEVDLEEQTLDDRRVLGGH